MHRSEMQRWAKTGLMHCNKNSEAFRYRSTVKSVAEVQFEARYPALQCSGHDPIGVGANGNRHRKTAIHIRARTGDGRKREMAKGVRFGRKPKLSKFQRQEALKPRRGRVRQELRRRRLDDLTVALIAPQATIKRVLSRLG